MSRLDINAARRDALFASALHRSDEPTPAEVRLAIMRMVRILGSRGCAERVAQEFGDHPEGAVTRMRWVRQLIEQAADQSGPPACSRAPRFTGAIAASAPSAA